MDQDGLRYQTQLAIKRYIDQILGKILSSGLESISFLSNIDTTQHMLSLFCVTKALSDVTAEVRLCFGIYSSFRGYSRDNDIVIVTI